MAVSDARDFYGALVFRRSNDMNPLRSYKRLLIKISGELFQGGGEFGLDMAIVKGYAQQLALIHKHHQLVVVVGGGNFFRGVMAQGMSRQEADEIGMLATVMNGRALLSALCSLAVPSCLLSTRMHPLYSSDQALSALKTGHLVICSGGTGNAFVTTDTAGVIRACELDCDIMLKGTKVDGVYSAPPETKPDAVFFPRLTYQEILEKRLHVMDLTAITLAKENALPLIVFSMGQGLSALVKGSCRYTSIQ